MYNSLNPATLSGALDIIVVEKVQKIEYILYMKYVKIILQMSNQVLKFIVVFKLIIQFNVCL